MKIEEISIESETYKDIVAQIGCVFNTPNWLKIYGTKLKTYGLYNKGGKLFGLFNLYFEKRMGFTQIKNPPFSPNIGLFFINPSSNFAKKQSFNKSIYKAVSEFINTLSASLITITLPIEHVDMQAFIWDDYKVIPNYTYQLNLSELNENTIKDHFSPERRNDIAKALKDNIECRLSSDYSLVKKMVEHTYNRKGKTLKDGLLSNILEQFKSTNSFAFVSYQKNKPIAASFVIYDKQTAYYLLGGYDPKHKHQGAGALAVYHAILQAKKIGIPIFDFEGSMLPEVERYFRGFGGELKILFTLNKGHLPMELLLKFFKRNQF